MVLTVNGEVHTNDEAQVYVHDLDLFVTVQSLEETVAAVLSLGKLCEDHGYSYEWVNGQKPRWTKEGKTINCMQNGQLRTSCCSRDYPPVLGAYRRQHRHRRTCLQQVQPKSEVTNHLHESGADHPQKHKTKIKRGMTVEMRTTRLRDLPDWLEESTDNLEDRSACTRTQFSGLRFGTSYESGIKIKEAVFCTHVPKDRNCEVCLQTKRQGSLAEDALAKLYLEQRSLLS